MSNDQASAVDGEQALLDALGPAPEEEQEQTSDEVTPVEGEDQPADEVEEPEAPAEDAPEVFKITVKNEAGEDEEKDITLDELAKGYMLQADYTRKTQEVAKEKGELAQKFHQDLTKVQQSSLDQIGQLRELVLRQAAPELASVDWVSLSVSDPAEFVRLQARQQQLNNTLHVLDQAGSQHARERDQHLNQQVEQALRHSDELLTKSIEGFSGEKAGKLLESVEKSIGWKPSDIRLAAAAMAQAGMRPETLGQVLLLAHKAIQYDELTSKKQTVLKKVAAAPKVIRPAAPQPKRTNKEAADRLRKYGRIDDLVKFL